jgi:hypothetical protein
LRIKEQKTRLTLHEDDDDDDDDDDDLLVSFKKLSTAKITWRRMPL